MKLYNNNFKLITIWRKVTGLGISFLNQPFFKVFDPSNDELHRRSCQGARVTGASSGIQIYLMIYYYEFLEKFHRLYTTVLRYSSVNFLRFLAASCRFIKRVGLLN